MEATTGVLLVSIAFPDLVGLDILHLLVVMKFMILMS